VDARPSAPNYVSNIVHTTPPHHPPRSAARDAFVLGHRGARNVVHADRPYAFFVEEEAGPSGDVGPVATIFLTNRECPYRCVMCDLWRNTLAVSVPSGAIARQIDVALAALPAAATVKLYNSGSFFDHRAIPPDEYEAIARRLRGFDRVIVECHPSLVGDDVLRFRDLLEGRLEVAMGLETAHPAVLEQLNKRMTLESYIAATERLRGYGVDTRAFVLVQPPFLPAAEAVDWAVRSAAFAFEHGAGAVSLIPVRAGNGALDAMVADGSFREPHLSTLEDAFDAALALGAGRVFADTWDLARFSSCARCIDARLRRLMDMNLTQRLIARAGCDAC